MSEYSDLHLVAKSSDPNAICNVAWINPVIILQNGKEYELTKKKWQLVKQGAGKTLANKDNQGNPLPNKAKGIGTDTQSVLKYVLPKNSGRFKAKVLLTDAKGAVTFTISQSPEPGKTNKLHSTPNSPSILPHVAMQSLLSLDAQDACIEALHSGDEKRQRGALAAMKFMHSEKVVESLISAAGKYPELKALTLETLVRLHQKENSYDGSCLLYTSPSPRD